MLSHAKKDKKAFRKASIRLAALAVILCLQMIMAAALSYYLQRLSILVMVSLYLLSVIACVFVSALHDNPSTRVFWLMLIALLPAFGLLIYLMWGLPRYRSKRHTREIQSHKDAEAALAAYSADLCRQGDACSSMLSLQYQAVRNASRYLSAYGFPLTSGTKVTYFSSGEALFADCLLRLEDAKKSIFMAFFILKEGKLWDQFHRILSARAAAGVEVRLLIDDAGTMFSLTDEFINGLRAEGIHVLLFNPTHRYLNNLYLNYRNHQKLVIIDSDTGYTGGVNLADEYANYISPHGYWKDTGVRLDGAGVFGMSAAFINMWDQTAGILSKSYAAYRPSIRADEEGLCQFFTDGPANNPLNPAEGLIFRMIESAHDYVYLTTPYLAASPALIETLCRVSRSGVRVVLLVPYQLDHWYVFEVTQSHFPVLLSAGVEVYRFAPGMLHAKMIVADDIHALVGTINLDNRSFYSQYEDGVWFCGKKAVTDVRDDIDAAIAKSFRVTKEDCRKIGMFRTFFGLLMRVFSPLM